MKCGAKLREAIQSRSLTDTTETISEIAERLDYTLRPPYTEVSKFHAREEDGQYSISFAARLYLHYSRVSDWSEGLVLVLAFDGEAAADSPSPPIQDLFYAATLRSVSAYGYGPRWKAKTLSTPPALARNLELTVDELSEIQLDGLCNAANGLS